MLSQEVAENQAERDKLERKRHQHKGQLEKGIRMGRHVGRLWQIAPVSKLLRNLI